MSQIAFFILEPLSAQPNDPADSKFFGLRTLSINLQSIMRYKIYVIWLNYCFRREHNTYMTLSI
jgi:hypothetical protein